MLSIDIIYLIAFLRVNYLNSWSKGGQTAPLNNLGQPVHLFRGELGKQDFYVLKGGPLAGIGISDSVKARLNQF